MNKTHQKVACTQTEDQERKISPLCVQICARKRNRKILKGDELQRIIFFFIKILAFGKSSGKINDYVETKTQSERVTESAGEGEDERE